MRSWSRFRALLSALVFAGCGQPDRPPNVVLITLDTTRADHLSLYGYAGDTSPNLDRFALDSVVYEHAYATSSWTLASHASLFTGLLPMQHGAQSVPEGPNRVLGYGVRPLAAEFSTLAERLGEAGFRRAAIVAGPALRSELGVAQGFETYSDDFETQAELFHGRRAGPVADEAIALVQEFGEEPFFLFVNFFDAHAPYRPPAPFDEGLPPRGKDELLADFIEKLRSGTPPVALDELEPEAREQVARLKAGYDAEIRYMDHHLGRLLDALYAPGANSTLVVITGDHGESFGEHFYLSHGAHLYEDNVRVPLVVRYPGQTRGERVSEPVSNVAVFSTILEATGLDAPPDTSLRAGAGRESPIVLQVQRSDANVRLFGEFFDRDLVALHAPPYKLIRSSDGTRELFDLERDPQELDDLAGNNPALVSSLEQELEAIREASPPLFDEASRAALRPETEQSLRALGYIE